MEGEVHACGHPHILLTIRRGGYILDLVQYRIITMVCSVVLLCSPMDGHE